MPLGGALPRSIDAGRLERILRLAQPQIGRLLKPLKASASEQWTRPEYSDHEFCRALVDFIGAPQGLAAYQAAASEIEEKVSQWTLTIDACVFRDLTQRFFDDPDFRKIFPGGEAAEIGADGFEAVGQFLAEREEWPRLAEFAWAVAIRSNTAAFLRDAVSKYEELEEEVHDVMESLEEDDAELEQADEDAAGEEAADAEPADELEQAVTALNRFRAQVNQLDAKALDIGALDGLLEELGKLRDLAETLEHHRESAALLVRFEETSAKFKLTIASVDAEAGIEAQRERLSQPGAVSSEIEAWLEVLAERLETIAGLDSELQGLMRQITVAAGENDLDAIGRHTGTAQERRTAREQEVGALRRHLGQDQDEGAGAATASAAPAEGEEDTQETETGGADQ